MILEFEILGLPKMTNTLRKHWTVIQKERAKWKRLVVESVFKSDKRQSAAYKRANVTLTRCSSVECDFDGLVSSFKGVLDGLVEAGVIIDDKMSVIGQPKYLWQKAKPKEGKIMVRVEGVE